MNTIKPLSYRERQQALSDALEQMVDAHCLADVLDALALVCSAKGDHVRSNWQDEHLASAWEDMAGHVLAAQFKAEEAQL